MKCAILDDASPDRFVLERYCQRTGLFESVFSSEEPAEFIRYLKGERVDLVFLDVHLPQKDGFEVMNLLDESVGVVFMSVDPLSATTAFDHDAIDFLLKPISFKRFQRSVQKVADFQSALQALKNSASKKEELFIKVKGSYVKIDLDQLLFIQAKGDYVEFVSEENSYTIHSTLKNAINSLPGDRFIKVHRSYAINLDKVIDLSNQYVEVGNHRISVSKANREILKKKLGLR